MLSAGLADEVVLTLSRSDHDDADLVRRAQHGNTDAFEELVVLHGSEVYRYLAVRLGNDADAKDALQETLAAAWLGLSTLRTPSHFRAWLVGIATHKATDCIRRRLRVVDAEPAVWLDDAHALEIREALRRLPESFREVLLLRYLLQLSEEEAALVLGVRVGTVKSRSARARRALQELLS
jgi:RNA polymerase sigma-70 factor, ECF subfamily